MKDSKSEQPRKTNAEETEDGVGGLYVVMSVGECARAYINSRWDRKEIRLETRRSFRESLGILVDFLGEDKRITAVKRTDIERWKAKMTCSPATVRLRLSTARGMFRWAVVEGYVKADPTMGVRGPKNTRTVPRGLPEDIVAKVLARVVDARERLLVLLMLEEGLRAIEVANLELGDIDLGGRTMKVEGKGGHGRELPITDTVAAAIEAYMAERGRNSGALLQSYQRSYASDSDGLSAKYVARVASNAIRRSGMRESGHALRHTFAHSLIDAGASIRDVQGALGHTSIVTTQVYLGHAEIATLRGFMGRRESTEDRATDTGAA